MRNQSSYRFNIVSENIDIGLYRGLATISSGELPAALWMVTGAGSSPARSRPIGLPCRLCSLVPIG